VASPEDVRAQFRKVKPLKDIPVTMRGWMLDILNIVHRLGKSEFTNQDVYAFERELEKLHPGNRHIRDKIRQQLQNLAKAGLLIHVGRNDYRLK
jgi:type II restriction enzyme